MNTIRLEQKKFFRRVQTFVIADSVLEVSTSGPTQMQAWKVPLAALNPEPVRIKKRAVVPWVLAAPLAVVMALFALATGLAISEGKNPAGLLFLSFGLGVLAILAFAKARSGSIDVLTFQSRAGHQVALWFENPDSIRFEGFVAHLKHAIEKSPRELGAGDMSVSKELQRLKQLHDQGIIDDDQFEAAKNKVTGLDRGPLGF